VYTRSYNEPHTKAIFTGGFEIEFDGRVNDDTNVYHIMGDCGDQTGSKNYSFGVNGGKKELGTNWEFRKDSDGHVRANADNIAANNNVRVIGDFTLPTGALAPIIDPNNSFYASVVYPTSFLADVHSDTVNSNGGYINKTQVQWNTAPSDSGAPNIVGNYLTSIQVTGLRPNTTYYFRMRISNDWYGWSEWSRWIQVNLPGAPPSKPSVVLNSSGQVTASVGVNTDSWGLPVDAYEIAVNTSQTTTGAMIFGTGDLQGLLPDTTYYASGRAHNSLGWSAWSDWITIITRPSVMVNVNGAWKKAIPYVNVNGVWKIAARYIRSNDHWKE
jgi:hypothetical protein